MTPEQFTQIMQMVDMTRCDWTLGRGYNKLKGSDK